MVSEPISVWMVMTGEGRIVLSTLKGPLAGTPAGRCLESRMEKASLSHLSEMPKFKACYRNVNYPFIFAK
jgi:hypothetical protein